MKKRVIYILLLWFCAFIPAFLLKGLAEAVRANSGLSSNLYLGSLAINYVIIIVGGIAIGKRLRKDATISISRNKVFERLIFVLIIWIFYYFSEVYYPILYFIEAFGINLAAGDVTISPARQFIYELIFAPEGFFALILCYATVELTLSKKKTVPTQ